MKKSRISHTSKIRISSESQHNLSLFNKINYASTNNTYDKFYRYTKET